MAGQGGYFSSSQPCWVILLGIATPLPQPSFSYLPTHPLIHVTSDTFQFFKKAEYQQMQVDTNSMSVHWKLLTVYIFSNIFRQLSSSAEELL